MNLDLRPMLRGETNRISMDFLLEPDELYGVSFGDGIHVVGEVTNQGGYMRLVATADVPYTGECARCLDPVSGVFSLPFERTVVTEGTLTEEQEEERVDKCIAALIDSLSRSFIQKMIKEGRVCINGLPVKASYQVKAGDDLSFLLPKAQEPDIEPENIPLDILYEDSDVLVVNKPKDMVVHPAAGHYSHTLVNAVLYHCRGQLSGINGVLRPGIVHRIDKDTTGSVIVCKNDAAHQALAVQFADHTITRRYRAIVHGVLTDDEGIIDAPIGRDNADRKKMAVNQVNGKRAVTHYTVLKRFERFTYIECRLETGRTHQIRVHMASIGHPLLGDSVYGPKKCPFPKLEGQTLHAMILGFVHPRTGAYIETSAPLPEYFQRLLDLL